MTAPDQSAVKLKPCKTCKHAEDIWCKHPERKNNTQHFQRSEGNCQFGALWEQRP